MPVLTLHYLLDRKWNYGRSVRRNWLWQWNALARSAGMGSSIARFLRYSRLLRGVLRLRGRFTPVFINVLLLASVPRREQRVDEHASDRPRGGSDGKGKAVTVERTSWTRRCVRSRCELTHFGGYVSFSHEGFSLRL